MVEIRLCRRAMACNFNIILGGSDAAYLRDVGTLVLDEVERLDRQFSYFNETSEVSYLNTEAAHRPVVVGPDLFRLLQLTANVCRDTAGAFDVTAAPLISLWREAEATGVEPDRQSIDKALSTVGMDHIHLDEQSNSVYFDIDGVEINLGAIGKGYAVRRAAEILREYSIESALISGGKSTICAIGAQISGDAWNVGIRHPSEYDKRVAVVQLSNNAMSTSGGPEQRDEVVNERFEHIINSTTGEPVKSETVSVSVIAEDPALTDALSTAFYLKGKRFAEDYCNLRPDVGAVFVEKVDGSLVVSRIGSELR